MIAKPLLALGVPMGPDVLLTVRGRKSGLPRTTPVTVGERAGRRGIIGAFGESNWSRNLRAAGTATIRFGRRREQVRAVELTGGAAIDFLEAVLVPMARESRLGAWFVRHVDKIDLDDLEGVVRERPVFEIFPLDG